MTAQEHYNTSVRFVVLFVFVSRPIAERERFGATPAGRSEAAPVPPASRPAPCKGWSRARPFAPSAVERRAIPEQFRASLKVRAQGKVPQDLSVYRVWAASCCAVRFKRFQYRLHPEKQKKKSKKGCRHTPLFTWFGPPHVAQFGNPKDQGRPEGRPLFQTERHEVVQTM